jgi:hypothetical protein
VQVQLLVVLSCFLFISEVAEKGGSGCGNSFVSFKGPGPADGSLFASKLLSSTWLVFLSQDLAVLEQVLTLGK